jgi:phosphotransferase system enzyme I (PtsI)
METKETRFVGLPVSPGIAIGKVHFYFPYIPLINHKRLHPDEINDALNCYKKAQKLACTELDKLIVELREKKDKKADIFLAHKMMVLDPDSEEDINNKIKSGLSVSEAVDESIKGCEKELAACHDELLKERIMDMDDVERRILRCLEGKKDENLSAIHKPVILVTHDLTPSDTASLPTEYVLGIVTEIGGPTSHSAIIAKANGIPAVLGINGIVSQLNEGEEIIIDGVTGELFTRFDKEFETEYLKKKKIADDWLEEVRTYLDKEPVSKDDVRISVNLNIASGKPEELAKAKYVDGVGLFRTEFLYMGRATLPSEDEQFEVYKKVLLTFKDKPVTIRTLDIGGDKKSDCLVLPNEGNPFLGERALRYCLAHRPIFITQLRAILRASAYGKVNIMFPMVGSLDDIRAAKQAVGEAKASLRREGKAFSSEIKIGAMIEIPSIAIMADKLSQEVDFASVGSNDLCQYTLAVERGNENLRSYYQMFNPGLLRLLHYAIQSFDVANKPIAVCGEMGGNPLSAGLLIGLGLRIISMGGGNIAGVKKMIVQNSVSDLMKIGDEVLKLDTHDEIEKYLKDNIKK